MFFSTKLTELTELDVGKLVVEVDAGFSTA